MLVRTHGLLEHNRGSAPGVILALDKCFGGASDTVLALRTARPSGQPVAHPQPITTVLSSSPSGLQPPHLVLLSLSLFVEVCILHLSNDIHSSHITLLSCRTISKIKFAPNLNIEKEIDKESEQECEQICHRLLPRSMFDIL